MRINSAAPVSLRIDTLVAGSEPSAVQVEVTEAERSCEAMLLVEEVQEGIEPAVLFGRRVFREEQPDRLDGHGLLGVDLGAFGRGDLEGLDRERGVVAGVDGGGSKSNLSGQRLDLGAGSEIRFAPRI